MELRNGKRVYNSKYVVPETYNDIVRYLTPNIRQAKLQRTTKSNIMMITRIYEYINAYYIKIHRVLDTTTQIYYKRNLCLFAIFLRAGVYMNELCDELRATTSNKNLIIKSLNVLEKSYFILGDFIGNEIANQTEIFVKRSSRLEYNFMLDECLHQICNLKYKDFTYRKYYVSGVFEELYKNLLHPDNIPKFAGWGFEGFEHYAEM